MVDTKSCGYSNSGQLSECRYSGLFFTTRPSPTININFVHCYLVKGVREYLKKSGLCCSGKDGKVDSWFLFNSYKHKIQLQRSKNRFLKGHKIYNKMIKYYTKMLNDVYFYYILSIHSDLISKTLHLITNTPNFSCGYISFTPVEDFTAFRVPTAQGKHREFKSEKRMGTMSMVYTNLNESGFCCIFDWNIIVYSLFKFFF